MNPVKILKSGVIPGVLAGVYLFSPAASAAEWKYAMKEALTDPQGLYAMKWAGST